jgi:hypothetical protein
MDSCSTRQKLLIGVFFVIFPRLFGYRQIFGRDLKKVIFLKIGSIIFEGTTIEMVYMAISTQLHMSISPQNWMTKLDEFACPQL